MTKKARTCTFCGYPKGMRPGEPIKDRNGHTIIVWRCEACHKAMRCEPGVVPGPHSVASLFRIG